MAKKNPYILDFKIDKLSDSILNRISGDSFRTEISLATKEDLKSIEKSKRWLFNWKYEFGQINREVYKLTILDNPGVVQGLISLSVKIDHVYMYLLESAPFNVGKIRSMREYQAIWSPLHVSCPFREEEKVLSPSNQKQN